MVTADLGQEEPSVTSPLPPLPRVDITEQKFARKAREAHRLGDEKLSKKYTRYLKTLRRRVPSDYDRVQDHYRKKVKKIKSDLCVSDYRLSIVKDKGKALRSLAQRLSQLPADHLAKSALDVTKMRRDLKYFHGYFDSVEMVQKKIEEYLEEKVFGGETKRIESSWEDPYLYILRDQALALVEDAPEHFDLVRKYEILDKLQTKYDQGRGKISKERIDYKREKADALLNALLYSIPQSASTLADLRDHKEEKLLENRSLLEKKLAKTKAKALSWSAIEPTWH